MSEPWIETEIAEQPELLRRLLERGRSEWASRELAGCERVFLVGCGDMAFAAEAAAWQARLVGADSVTAARSMDMRWWAPRLGLDDLVLCASISGRTPRTIEAARLARQAGARVVALTDNAGSALTQEATETFLLETSPPEALADGVYPGYHHQIAQTKTFLAALLAEWLALEATRGREADLTNLADAVSEAIAASRRPITEAASAAADGRDRFVVLASGPYLPIAHYVSAKLKEYGLDSQSQCLEEFNHLEMFRVDEKTLITMLAPDVASLQRARELDGGWDALGARSWLVNLTGDDAGLDWTGGLVGLLQVAVVGQRIALALAAAAGCDLDRWLGGLRIDVVNEVSNRVIRGSVILE